MSDRPRVIILRQSAQGLEKTMFSILKILVCFNFITLKMSDDFNANEVIINEFYF